MFCWPICHREAENDNCAVLEIHNEVILIRRFIFFKAMVCHIGEDAYFPSPRVIEMLNMKVRPAAG